MLAGLTIALLVAELPAQGWAQRNTLTAPAARSSFAMAQDVGRNVAVLFGGDNGTATGLSDTWEWNGFGWAQRFTPVAPPARWGHGMVYDTRRSRVVLFGGFSPTGPTSWLADTWEWDGASWSQRSLSAQPPARGYFGMAYDSWRGQALVFGGETAANQHLDDTWAFDGAAWSQIVTATRPSVRRGVAMTFDDTRGESVLFGGSDATQVFGDTWTFDGIDWQQRTPANSPSARQEARLGHDGLCGRTVLHGGADNAFANSFGDSWEWNGSGWTAIAGASPSGRHGAGMAFDAQRGQMALWGGRDANGFFSDSWQLASPCSRTMSVVTAPQLMLPAVFRYSYPPSAAGHFGIHLLTLHQAGGFAVPIPGFSSFGQCFVDLFSVQLQTFTLLDGSGVSDLVVQMPGDPYLIGLPFDVQAVDISFQASAVYWAGNDVEAAIAPLIPPVASFTATPTSGVAPLAVQFTDTSTNGPTSWHWDFDNDGVVDSTQQNPSFAYTVAGLYSVRLVAANLGGSNASLRSGLINAGPLAPNPALNLVPIAAGTFQMGSTIVGGSAMPAHAVTITQPFWVGKYEVTQAEYLAVMGSNPSQFQGANYPNSLQRPVEGVAWANAMAYCASLSESESASGRVPAGYQYRLPTDAEWEYVCRAGTTTEWNTGDSLTTAQGNFSNAFSQTTVVGSYPANPWGLFDTHGNAWEWCLDSWDGSANYPASAVTDPYVSVGPGRIIRGGGWVGGASNCRSAIRGGYFPGSVVDGIGFRVVLAPVLVPRTSLGMVRIEPGTFQMGSSAIGGRSAPVHTVTITRPFWAGAYEVTQAEYQSVMGINPATFPGAQRPVETVSWNSAMAYCAALTAAEAAAGRIPTGCQYRLPTEAEWEYVCRAGTTTEWNTGTSLVCVQANFSGCSPGQTTVVGNYAANAWGLFDTHGNAWEWCLDSWDLSANYPSSAVSDPYGPGGSDRVVRGGSWLVAADDCRSASRGWAPPGYSSNEFGFRVVLAPILVP